MDQVLKKDEFDALAQRLTDHGVAFVIPPQKRFEVNRDRHAPMFDLILHEESERMRAQTRRLCHVTSPPQHTGQAWRTVDNVPQGPVQQRARVQVHGQPRFPFCALPRLI